MLAGASSPWEEGLRPGGRARNAALLPSLSSFRIPEREVVHAGRDLGFGVGVPEGG